MLHFHALMFPRPAGDLTTERVLVQGHPWETLQATSQQLHAGWGMTWEEMMERLAQLPRLYAEPDGSFTWTSAEGKLSGIIYDREGRMCYAELFGECTSPAVDLFLTAAGWPEQAFVFQLPRAGIILSDEHFRNFTFQTDL